MAAGPACSSDLSASALLPLGAGKFFVVGCCAGCIPGLFPLDTRSTSDPLLQIVTTELPPSIINVTRGATLPLVENH